MSQIWRDEGGCPHTPGKEPERAGKCSVPNISDRPQKTHVQNRPRAAQLQFETGACLQRPPSSPPQRNEEN